MTYRHAERAVRPRRARHLAGTQVGALWWTASGVVAGVNLQRCTTTSRAVMRRRQWVTGQAAARKRDVGYRPRGAANSRQLHTAQRENQPRTFTHKYDEGYNQPPMSFQSAGETEAEYAPVVPCGAWAVAGGCPKAIGTAEPARWAAQCNAVHAIAAGRTRADVIHRRICRTGGVLACGHHPDHIHNKESHNINDWADRH